ncbi:MAG: hypothetical protein JRG70_07020 [Deltaproteobacteria bacterium]|nr:hypothetical protein [Deltaproteobacteria bacterium]
MYGLLDLLSAAVVGGLMRLLWSGGWFWPVALGVWAGLLLASAVGLFSGTRAGRFAARLAAFYQLGFLAVLIVGLLSSAAYLWGLYGEVGIGVAVLLLIILALLIELVGLLPIFKLRSIGVFEREPGALRRIWPVTAVLVPGVVLYCMVVHARATLTSWEPTPAADRDAMSRHLMAVVENEAVPLLPTDQNDRDDHWVVRVYRAGKIKRRIEVGGNLATAAQAAALELGRERSVPVRRRAVAIDRIVAETNIDESNAILAALSIVPGLDGITGEIDGHRFTITPHELVLGRMLSEQTPISFIPDFKAGVRLDAARRVLCLNAGRSPDCEVTNLRRARTESWVHYNGETLDIYRGRPMEERAPTAVDARAGALAGGHYIVKALQRDGRFRYKLYPESGKVDMEPYAIPRHAGTSWFLLELSEATGETQFLHGAEQALDWLEQQLGECGDGLRCVAGGGVATLGSQALPLIAFATHARVTGSDRYRTTIDRLAEVVMRLQQDNGDFQFVLDTATGRPVPGPRVFYAAGQAALALAISGQVTEEARHLQGARDALDFMAGPYWDFFVSDLFFIEEHWTCLAADEVHRLYGDPDHAKLCRDVAGFYQRLQHAEGETTFPDYVGGVGFSPFFPPHTTPTAARTEALIAAYRISVRQGRPDAELRKGIAASVRFLLHNQYGPRDTYPFRSAWTAIGGVPWNYLDPVIRIDTVQHAGAVMLRGGELLSDLSPD